MEEGIKNKNKGASRNWFLTWNNYPVDYQSVILQFPKLIKWCFQPEIGKNGTPHIQGVLVFQTPRRLSAMKKLQAQIHWEIPRNVQAAVNYCQKSETKNGDTITNMEKEGKPIARDPLDGIELFPWQVDLLSELSLDPEITDRSVHWFWDPVGTKGKTAFAKHCCLTMDALYVVGRAADMKYAIAQYIADKKKFPKIVFLNLTRSSEQFVSYQGIEEIKDGIFFSTKYESGMAIFDPPHVCIFANFHPDITKLSEDRWRIKKL